MSLLIDTKKTKKISNVKHTLDDSFDFFKADLYFSTSSKARFKLENIVNKKIYNENIWHTSQVLF